MDDLEKLAGNKNTWKTWRDHWKAVPADRIMPRLLEWWAARAHIIRKAREMERHRLRLWMDEQLQEQETERTADNATEAGAPQPRSGAPPPGSRGVAP